MTSFESIRDKILAGGRLSAAEGEFLFRPEVDLHALGRLANEVRRQRHGAVAYYNLNAHLNPTNVCEYRCPLCAYSCDPGDQRAYVAGMDEILARGQEASMLEALRLGVTLVPTAEVLWRTLLRAVSQVAPAEVDGEITQMYSVLAQHGVRPEPQTDALVLELAPARAGTVGS